MKIAIGLNGSGKYLEFTSKLYEEYNNLYDDVEFHFYLATWEDELDYSDFILSPKKWITDYVRLKEEDSIYYDITNSEYLGHQPHYMFTSYHLNKLIKKNNVKYDAIIQTRSDLVLGKSSLDPIIKKIKTGYITERLMWNIGGVSTFYKPNSWSPSNKKYWKNKPFLWMNDSIFIGHPSVIESFSMAWVSFFLDSTSLFYQQRDHYILNHIWPAEFLIKSGISVQSIPSLGAQLLIRENFRFGTDDTAGGWDLKHPSVYQFEKLLKEKEAKWIIENLEKCKDEIFTKTYKGPTKDRKIKGISKASDASRNTSDKIKRGLTKKKSTI